MPSLTLTHSLTLAVATTEQPQTTHVTQYTSHLTSTHPIHMTDNYDWNGLELKYAF